jgi:tetratricopeptide (TPR) repeat protein
LHLTNILVALQWSENNDLTLFAQLLDAIESFLMNRGQSALLKTYFPKGIAAAKQMGNDYRSANLLKSFGDLESRLGNIDEARKHYDAALPLYRREQDRLGEASIYMSLGDIFIEQKKWVEARTYYERALPLYTLERDSLGLANTLIDLGRARFESGYQKQGIADVQRAADLYRQIQNPHWANRAGQYLEEMHARLQTGSEMEQ